MNSLDFIILVILGYCLIRGFFRGVIKEVSSVIGVVGGFFAARLYYADLSNLLTDWVAVASYRDILGFVLAFGVVFFTVSILGVILKYLMKVALLGWVDRLFGIGIGCLKGILVVSILLFVLTTFLPKGVRLLEKSILAGKVHTVSEQMSKLVSKEMRDKFNEKVKDLKTTWDHHQSQK